MGTNVAICYKHDAMAFGSGIVEMERGGFAEAKPYLWQTDTDTLQEIPGAIRIHWSL